MDRHRHTCKVNGVGERIRMYEGGSAYYGELINIYIRLFISAFIFMLVNYNCF